MMQLKSKLRGSRVAHWIECTRKNDPPFSDFNTMDAKLVEEALDVLQEGSTLWKVKSFSTWYRRRYVFDMENKRIIYEGSRKLPCLEPSETIEISEIHDVRKGWKTDTFNKMANKVAKQKQKSPSKPTAAEENRCFSVIYGPDHKTLDLVAPNEDLCNAWVRGISHLIAVQRSIERDQNYKIWLKEQFRLADTDKSGALNFQECIGLLNQLGVDANELYAKKLFDQANTNKAKRDGEDVIDEDEFVAFYRLLKQRPELEEIYGKYTGGSNVLGPFQLATFIRTEQKVTNITLDDACDIIDVYEPTQVRADGFMTFDGFTKMLLSEVWDIFNIDHKTVYMDMERPLCDYYIASSHNTYLMADQLTGESSIEAYIRAFQEGCRCVELDLWDGPDNEPIVYHGYTLTSKIMLKDILQDAIKPYAFATSEYPVILSLENHLSIEQQKVLAKHFKRILGDMLYTQPITRDMTSLPSPYELRKKVIIKNKKLSDDDRLDHMVSDSEDEDEDRKSPTPSGHGDPERLEKEKKRAKLAAELSDLVNLCKAVHFNSFAASKDSGKFFEMSSLSEKKALQLIGNESDNFIEYTQNQLIRIYPAGKRTDSSNYDPIPLWNVGCQIVALNYQTVGKPMAYNAAMFNRNGNCGYILKPEILRNGKVSLREIENSKIQQTMKLKIISGQHIPRQNKAASGDIIDPYVVVEIRGHPSDEQSVKTRHVHNNGFNPMWNESFSFVIKVPHLAFVHFMVKDYSMTGRDIKLAEYCLPFNSVQLGYRHVHLADAYSKPLVPASLFVHVDIE